MMKIIGTQFSYLIEILLLHLLKLHSFFGTNYFSCIHVHSLVDVDTNDFAKNKIIVQTAIIITRMNGEKSLVELLSYVLLAGGDVGNEAFLKDDTDGQ